MPKTLFWHAVNSGNYSLVTEKYIENPSKLTTPDEEKNTPLHVAIKKTIEASKKLDYCYHNIARFLLLVGHPLYLKNNEGKTPLDYDGADIKGILGPYISMDPSKIKLCPLDITLLLAKFESDSELCAILKRLEIEKVKEQQLLSQETSQLYDEYQYQFHEKLVNLTQENELKKQISKLSAEALILCTKHYFGIYYDQLFSKLVIQCLSTIVALIKALSLGFYRWHCGNTF